MTRITLDGRLDSLMTLNQDPSLVDRLNDAKAHIDVGIMEMAKDLANFNPGGTK